jgi:hypothetical protein
LAGGRKIEAGYPPQTRKPFAGVPPDVRTPNVGKVGDRSNTWAFTFRFWREHANFGFAFGKKTARVRWFVSLLNRLRELSAYDVDEFRSGSSRVRGELRYHDIDWNARNVPISRKDLIWVDSRYLNNDDEYPLVQFHLSKALGRVVGFWDENSLFNIVLLDPLHNIQPSKYNGHAVQPCSPLGCEHSELLKQVDDARHALQCPRVGTACAGRLALHSLGAIQPEFLRVVLGLSEDNVKNTEALLRDGRAKSFADIFETGLLTLLEQPSA